MGGHKVLEVGGEVRAVEAVFPDHPGRQAAQRTVSDRIRNLKTKKKISFREENKLHIQE